MKSFPTTSAARYAIDFAALVFAQLSIFALEVLPKRTGVALVNVILTLLRAFIPRFDHAGLRNLQIAFPEKSESERAAILAQSYDVLARNLVAFAKIPRMTKAKAESSVDQAELATFLELFAEARQQGKGKGVLIATPHFGSYETFAQMCCFLYRPISILARGFGLPKTDRWWNNRRSYFGNRLFFRKGGYKEIVRRLNEGQDVLVLFDQNVKKNHAVFVRFFGLEAATTKAVALAAMRTGAAVIFVAGTEIAEDRYSIVTERIPLFEQEQDREERTRLITQAATGTLEQLIRRYPKDWFWIHRRFNTRPPGEPETIYS